MTSRESTTLISPTHTLEVSRPLQILSTGTSPVIAQMMTICNIEECSLLAYDTFMVKLVNACLPLLSCSSAIHFAIFSKYRDTYRIATQVSRYVSYRGGTVSLRPYKQYDNSAGRVYDGSALIHRLAWPKIGTMSSVCEPFVGMSRCQQHKMCMFVLCLTATISKQRRLQSQTAAP